MVNGRPNTAYRHLARVFHEGTLTGLSDGEMLERFVESRDETAFEALVTRHGTMVFNVCRQLLRDPHDVEDAVQAVFLVLVRKAGSIRVKGSLGPWLYTVANRVAARARANRRRQATQDLGSTAEIAAASPENGIDRNETAAVIQEELGRLPARLRAPLVLCYLQGMTHELAAAQLGCPVGTVRSRLSRGRAALLRRITRRGLALSAAGLVSALESNARGAPISAPVRFALIRLATTSLSETAVAVGGLGASASVAILLEGVLNVMRIKKLAILAGGLVVLGTLGVVIAERTAAVGGPSVQQSAPSDADSDSRTAGPDEKPAGARTLAKLHSETFTKTYYVGDIIALPPRPKTGSSASVITEQPMVDMTPVVDLITSTVAPGTWHPPDHEGAQIVTSETNVIAAFYLSSSLIVRCQAEVHKQVGSLLRGLRILMHARDENMFRVSQGEAARSAEAVQSDAVLPAPAPFPRPSVRRQAQQLRDDLQIEIQRLKPMPAHLRSNQQPQELRDALQNTGALLREIEALTRQTQ